MVVAREQTLVSGDRGDLKRLLCTEPGGTALTRPVISSEIAGLIILVISGQ